MTLQSSSLALLSAIRDIMASPVSAQARLDLVVKTIASGFASEVCSVYLLRAGDILELFASEGLNPGSVHLTRLNVGEGLVGEIAAVSEPINLAEAAMHPRYVYRPETGEEIYHSFVGVPIMQAGRVIGVLVVQGKEARSFTPEQVAVLQTVAMVLSELAVSNQFVSVSELETATSAAMLAQKRVGIRLSPGIAQAPAVLFESRRAITQLVSSDETAEKTRLEAALLRLQNALEEMLEAARAHAKLEEHDILEAYLLLTHDKGWHTRIESAIASGLTAEAAVRKVEEELRARMTQVSNPYIRERMQDLEEISNRLIAQLLGDGAENAHVLPEKYILVARSIGPAEILELDSGRICGLVLEEGSASSHTAVVARAMDLPAIAGVERASSIIHTGDMLILDADAGELHIRPSDDLLQIMEEKRRLLEERKAHYATLIPLPPVTQDGVRISLNINAGLVVNKESLEHAGVDGIGLYRTELPYMAAAHFPSVEMQTALYRSVLEDAGDKRVTFRSLDIGGDKAVPYFTFPREENPAMGWRGARIYLDRPRMLQDQLTGLIRASDGKELSLMFPFIAQTGEIRVLKELLSRALESERKQYGRAPSRLRVGVMLEIPSLLWQLPELVRTVDFIAIGSNDLLQFFFACDRGSEQVAERYDPLSPVVLRMIAQVADACREAQVDLSFCGDMARKPLETMALIGSGVESLSMPSSALAPVKEMVRSLRLKELRDYLRPLMQLDVPSLRNRLQEYAHDHSIIV